MRGRMRPKDSLGLALACLALALLALLLAPGCLPGAACPPGTYPVKVDTDEGGTGQLEASVPVKGGKASVGAGRSVDWTCKRLCRADELWTGERCEAKQQRSGGGAEPLDGR